MRRIGERPPQRDHAVHPDPRPLYDAIRAAIDRRGGAIEIVYVTMAFVAATSR